MGAWVGVGFVAFFVVSLAVGIRLLMLWHRTRQLPELLIGIGVLGIGPVGFGALMAGMTMIARGAAPDGLAVECVLALGSATVIAGVVAKCIFNWQVYRPDSAAARAVTVGVTAGLIGLYIHSGWTRGFVPAQTVDGFSLLQTTLQVGALFWGSGEALHYWRRMRRRAALGLADPVVTNRFVLWAFGAGAAGLGTAIGTVASWLIGMPSLQIPWVVASSSAHGMAAAIAMWLAFLPPRAYTNWIRSNAAATAAG